MLVGLVAIYAIANTLYFEWYWPPVSVMLAARADGGAHRARERGAERLRGARARAQRASRGAASASPLLGVWLAVVSFAPMRYDDIATAQPDVVRRDRTRCAAACSPTSPPARRWRGWPRPATAWRRPSSERLGAAYRGRILDPCGLISREAMPFLPIPRDQQARIGAGAITVDFVQATEPDWIVALPTFISAGLAHLGLVSPALPGRGNDGAAVRDLGEPRDPVIFRQREQPLPPSR